MAHTIVKICGITRLEDARHAALAGADWIGFVLQGESPRRISAARARTIVDAIGDRVVTVGVMVAPTPEEALVLAREAGITRVQLHGVDPASWPAEFPLPVAFAVPVAEDGAMLSALPPLRDRCCSTPPTGGSRAEPAARSPGSSPRPWLPSSR
jgi:phosphoribosylanthranilate isomerase